MAETADLAVFWVRCHFDAGNGVVGSGLLLEVSESADEAAYVVVYRDEVRDTLEAQDQLLWIAPEDQIAIQGDIWVPQSRLLRLELVPIA